MTLELVNHTRHRVPRKYLAAWVTHVSKGLGRKDIGKALLKDNLVVAFVSPAKIKALNNEFRGKNKKTDVLSFSSMEPGSLGELVLCPVVLQAQAKEHNLSYRQEVAYMVLHGILHLLGYEHEEGGKKADEMYALQDKIFREIDKIN